MECAGMGSGAEEWSRQNKRTSSMAFPPRGFPPNTTAVKTLTGSAQALVGQAVAKVGQGNAFKNKWIKKDGDEFVSTTATVTDHTAETLRQVEKTRTVDDAKLLADLRKRQLVRTIKVITYQVSKGPKYAKEMPVEVTDLTADMLANEAWKSASFKAYNFKALGASQNAGALHPLNKVRKEFRDIFFNMGFIEMPTAKYVETGFWNFDALYVPQQHPARDLQDTFFISDPPKADVPRIDPIAERDLEVMEASTKRLYQTEKKHDIKPRDYKSYWEDIKKVHQDGAFGSIGYRYPWTADESLRLVLRTHTTAVSAYVLHRLAEDPRPGKAVTAARIFSQLRKN
jgi:phenylalanyl-tRNA synthetase alpha chain